ncbi:MAG: hypothetical protein HZA89_02210 [Verrucomicrobia bacterium]|nr:hypothetical protein [Verrucomicrobiota bacterium]
MKKLLTLLAALSLTVGAAYAGCGKTETTKGTLEKYDAEKKAITVKGTDGKSVTLTLTPGVKGDIKALVGKSVTAVSSHKKVESLTKS